MHPVTVATLFDSYRTHTHALHRVIQTIFFPLSAKSIPKEKSGLHTYFLEACETFDTENIKPN